MDEWFGLIVLFIVAFFALVLWKAFNSADAALREWERRHPTKQGNWTGDE